MTAAAHMTSIETILAYLILAYVDLTFFGRDITIMSLPLDATARVVLVLLDRESHFLSLSHGRILPPPYSPFLSLLFIFGPPV